jgi:ribonuclease III
MEQQTTLSTEKIRTSYVFLKDILEAEQYISSDDKSCQKLRAHPLIDQLFNHLQISDLDIASFLNAVTHSSIKNEWPEWPYSHNERLEFLGDAILQWLTSEKLYFLFEKQREGELSKLRGALVNREILADWARVLGLSQCILMGRGEHTQKLYLQSKPLSDAFEALLAAVYLNFGPERTKNVFNHWVDLYEAEVEQSFFDLAKLKNFDPKSRLQEISMSLYKERPEYRESECLEGFKVELFLCQQRLAILVGCSKKKIQRDLAQQVLEEKTYLNLKE